MLRHLRAVPPVIVLLGSTYSATSAAQAPSDSTPLPPIVFGIGAVGATLLTNTDVRGIGLDAELAVPLPRGAFGYRLHGFGTYVANYGNACGVCVSEGGSVSGASLDILYLGDVQDRVARTRISAGPALVAVGETDTKQLTYQLGADLGITRFVSVGSSSAYSLSLEPVLTTIDRKTLWFVMLGVGGEFW